RDGPPASRRRGFRAIKKCRVATNARPGGVQTEEHLRTPPRMREWKLLEITYHASCPSCAMQEGRFWSAENLTSNPSTLVSPNTHWVLKRFPNPQLLQLC